MTGAFRDACDCHVHLFGPETRYPFDPQRIYTPGHADENALLAMHRRIGIERVVLVQPSVYGIDNTRLLDGLTALGPSARGITVIDERTPDADLAMMHAKGVRGVRLNLATAGMNDPTQTLAILNRTAARVAPFGWHVQTLMKMNVIAALGAALTDLPTPLVIDHFGLPDIMAGPEQPAFALLCQLVQSGRLHVKLSAIERLTGAGQGRRLAPLVQALVEANANALIWGSDWPHTGAGRKPGGAITREAKEIEPFDELDDALALAALSNAIQDKDLLRRILVLNPARLYDFANMEL